MSEEVKRGEIVKDELVVQPIIGEFVSSLQRNNNKIRQDRAAAIARQARIKYKRKTEDIEQRIFDLQESREALLDLSPANSLSLTPAADFDPDKWVEQDLEIGLKLRDENIKLDVLKNRYSILFGVE